MTMHVCQRDNPALRRNALHAMHKRKNLGRASRAVQMICKSSQKQMLEFALAAMHCALGSLIGLTDLANNIFARAETVRVRLR